MKSIHLLLIPLLALTGFTSPSYIPAIQNPNPAINRSSVQDVFSYLRCHRQAKNIVVNWGVGSTAGIDHFIVYHSEDNEFFDNIALISAEDANKYSFKHLSVFAGYHYYKIAAVLDNGAIVYSAVDVVRIVGH